MSCVPKCHQIRREHHEGIIYVANQRKTIGLFVHRNLYPSNLQHCAQSSLNLSMLKQIFFFFLTIQIYAQTIPVGMNDFSEERFRNQQLISGATKSFTLLFPDCCPPLS
jgi:hypothetical protein